MLLVALNLAVDRRIFLPCLEPGMIARPRRTDVLPGGKPVNVARALQAHGIEAEVLALLPSESATWLTERLAAEGLAVTGVPYPGAARDAVLIYEESGRITVLNGPGPQLLAADWPRFVEAFINALGRHRTVVCAGSLPPGAPDDGLAQLAVASRGAGARFILDSGPRWLRAALPAQPDLVSPNLAEALATLPGTDGEQEPVEAAADSAHEACEAAAALVDAGARNALVTINSAGVAYSDGRQAGFVDAVKVEVANPIGAGDAFLAGVAARLEADDALADAARWGVATAAAAISQWRPGAAERGFVLRLFDLVAAGRPR